MPLATTARQGPVGRPNTGTIAYRGHHTVHFFLALLSAAVAIAVLVLNLWAYYDEGHLLTVIGFVADVVATGVLFMTWFWGMFLAMSGTLPHRRFLYLIVHGLLGSLTPLIYPLVIGLQMDSLSSQPVGGTEIGLEFAALILLLTQFVSGWSVLGRVPWRMLVRNLLRDTG